MPSSKALAYAFLLLKFRLRSEAELHLRLVKKGFAEDSVAEAIAFLRARHYINDEEFSRAWLESRLRRRYSLRRVEQELCAKGISRKIISAVIERKKEEYREADVVREVARERLRKYLSDEPLKAKRKVYAFLMRRGFPAEMVDDAVQQL